MVAPYIKEKFDIGVLRTDGTKVGLMLRKDRNDVPFYQLYDDEYLSSQFFTGEPGYGNLPAEKELAIRQEDWRSGLGLEIYDGNDTKRYHKSTMDMRFRNMGLAGWKSTTVTKPPANPTAPTIVNADMELTTGWTGGSRSAVQAHGGTYSWAVSNMEVYQDLTGYVLGCQYTFSCWVWSADGVGNVARIGINDGVTSTYSSYHNGDSQWTQLSVSKTLAVEAGTRLRLLLYTTLGVTGYFDDATITSDTTMTVGTTVTRAEFNDLLYVNFGRILAKLNGTGTAFTAVAYMAASITSLEPMTISGTDYLFIAQGTSNNYWYATTAELITQSTAVVKTYKYFRVVHSASPTMWGNDGVNTIRSTVNPLNGGTAWSGQTTIASSADTITGLHTKAGALYISKEDMMYYLNSSGAVQNDLAPELATLTRSTDNGKNTMMWLNKIYMHWGAQSLLEEDSGTNTWRSPALSATGASEYNGYVMALAGDDQYLYAILDNSTSIEVLAGRLESIDGTTKWVWHCINETTLTGCETAFVSSVYQKRLWISSTSSSDSVYYIPLPTGYADVANDTNRSFQTGTTMETSWLHGNFKSTTKAFPALEVTMGHTYNAGRYFTVKYKKLGDSSWTSIGNYTGSATSMTQSRFIPIDASSNNPKSTLFKLQFTAVTDDTTITPILQSYNLKAVLYPSQREIIACKVYCSNEIQLKDGTIDKGSYDTIVATLNEARTATWPVTIYDINGDTQTVKFLPLPSGTPRWKVITNEQTRKFELEYSLLMQKVALS